VAKVTVPPAFVTSLEGEEGAGNEGGGGGGGGGLSGALAEEDGGGLTGGWLKGGGEKGEMTVMTVMYEGGKRFSKVLYAWH
jgi:hypothetical protein